MKQMTLTEMDGFLKGKCIPRDLKVNETNAEYLVRKFAELESKQETALRECRSAGITIDNLEAKCAALAAENARMNAFVDALLSIAWQGGSADGAEIQGLALKNGLLRQEVYSADEHETLVDDPGNFEDGDQVYFRVETPATDAFLAEVRAQGGAKALEDFAEFNIESIDPLDDEYTEVLKETARAARGFAAKLRREASSVMLQGAVPVTDNTNQQFESLSRGDK